MARHSFELSTLVPWWRRSWLIVLAILTLVFLIAPILIVMPMSFSDSRYLRFPPETWSLRWYQNYLGSITWMDATRTSAIVAVLTTLLAVPLGTAAAYGVHNATWRWARQIQFVILAPVMVPNIIIAVSVFFVFARVGLNGTITGLTMAHTMLALPFVFIAVLTGLRGYDMSQEQVARSLGMNRLRAFWHVTLPQIRPSVLSGALFAFITSLDEVVVAIFISAGQDTLTRVMFSSVSEEIDPTIAAISSLLITVTLALFTAQLLLTRERAKP